MTEATLNKLLDAGFEKSEIMALAGQEAIVTSETQKDAQQIVPTVVQPKESTQIPEAKTEDPERQPAQGTVTLSDAQFTQMMQQLNQQNASVDIPPKYDIKNVLGEHFKDIMIGG